MIARYGIPRNNDVSIYDDVVIGKKGIELNKAVQIIRSFKQKERIGFIFIILGFSFMLIHRILIQLEVMS